MTAPSADDLTAACRHLSQKDAALARAYEEIGCPNWRVIHPTYEALARMIAYQQISTKAAASIWGRICEAVDQITPEAILTCEDEDLRACGLSRPKISHMRSIAIAVTDGALDLEALHHEPIDDARRQLIAVKGIGPWTADVYLLTATGALDAFPLADVGLMESYRLLRDDDERLKPKDFARTAEAWRPYRGVATHLLWDWINTMRGRDTAPAAKA